MSLAQDASPLTNTMDVEGTYESDPKDLEAFGLNHVALDINAIVQKWNSYRFVSRL